jgi:HEPN domain-containing protein
MNPKDKEELFIWIQYSLDDLLAAKYLLLVEDWKFPKNICFLCQQSVEKIIKSIHIYENLNFAKIHNLNSLRNNLPDGWTIKESYPDLSELSEWAVEVRYPGDLPVPTIDDAVAAYDLAKAIMRY